MAELIIATVALGSMYVISNHENSENAKATTNTNANINNNTGKSSNNNIITEGYTNMGKPQNSLSNVIPPVPPVNYPVAMGVTDSNVQKYRNPNQTTDKFFDNTVYERVEKQTHQEMLEVAYCLRCH